MEKFNFLILFMIWVINVTVSSAECGPTRSFLHNGKVYQTFDCSPPIENPTPALLTNNNFEKGGDGGGKSECDNQYHDNSELIVALSTGWYDKGSRCGKMIQINYNDKQAVAKVVDECDSTKGFDPEHAEQPPCGYNIVDASDAVWDELGLNKKVGNVVISWVEV